MFSGWLWSHQQLSHRFNLLIFLMAKWNDLLRADQGTSHNTKLKDRNCQMLKLLVFCLPQEKSTILLYRIVLEIRSLKLVLLRFSEVSTGLALSGGFRGESVSLSFSAFPGCLHSLPLGLFLTSLHLLVSIVTTPTTESDPPANRSRSFGITLNSPK